MAVLSDDKARLSTPAPAPAEEAFIPQMEPWFGSEEKDAVSAYMDSGGWITEFRKTAEFEQSVAEFTGAKHAVAVNNGTISLTLAAIACGIGPGDEVIVPNFTMIATANAVKMLGATPVMVDVEPETLCLDLALTRRAITPRTKAVMFVNINGRSPDAGIDAFVDLCGETGLALIEDAAQALGSRFPDGRHMGTVGAVGSISFSSQKIVTTGQGGMLITNDDGMARKLRRLKDFGRASGGTDIHDSLGFNFKFTELQACIGIEQMKKLPARVAMKQRIYRRYQDGLARTPHVHLLPIDLACAVPWFIDILAERRDELRDHLKRRGIGARVMYPPVNAQPFYAQPGDFPVSAMVGSSGLWLPSSAQLTDADIDRVCAAVAEFYGIVA